MIVLLIQVVIYVVVVVVVLEVRMVGEGYKAAGAVMSVAAVFWGDITTGKGCIQSGKCGGTHTYIHTCLYIYVEIYRHAIYINTHVHTCKHIHIYMYICMYFNTYTHTYVYIYIEIHRYTDTISIHFIHTCMHIYIHT